MPDKTEIEKQLDALYLIVNNLSEITNQLANILNILQEHASFGSDAASKVKQWSASLKDGHTG